MSSSGDTDMGTGSLSTSWPAGTTTEVLLPNLTGKAEPARLPPPATCPTLARPMTSGRLPNRLLSRIRISLPPMLVKTTFRTVASVKPTRARLMTSWVGFSWAAAQVATHPELLAEAVGGLGARATAAPTASAAAATKKPTRRRAPRSHRAPRSGIIRFGPPGGTGAHVRIYVAWTAPEKRWNRSSGSPRAYRKGRIRPGDALTTMYWAHTRLGAQVGGAVQVEDGAAGPFGVR